MLSLLLLLHRYTPNLMSPVRQPPPPRAIYTPQPIPQVNINLGFYMLMPYLAQHLSTGAGLAAWTIGLILGLRNFSQQGLFLVGGTLADRLGYKPMIMSGARCVPPGSPCSG